MRPADEPAKIGSSPLAIAALQVISLEFADIIGEPLMGDGQFRHALFEPLMRQRQFRHALFESLMRQRQFGHALFEPLMRQRQLDHALFEPCHALFEPSVRPGQFSDLRYQLLETSLGFKPQSGYLLWKRHKLIAKQQAAEFSPPLWPLL
jgi:hypothetical protein